MKNLRFHSINKTFTWDLEPLATEYQVSISINGGTYSVLYEESDTQCVLNLSFACEVKAKGKTKTSDTNTWSPETDCIDNPIDYTP